jgi:nitrate/TMAO reductase-like tetraheme cytochrome c subunit
MANENCATCHNVTSWKKVTFDHDKTGFKLEGKHARKACAACHFKKNELGVRVQKFEGLSKECSTCHKDNHVGQFAENGKTDCTRCHGFERWEDSKYDHNTSRFKLEGAHQKVQCFKCHKQTTDERGTFVKYKYKGIECAVCHS